jgi:hypothetical protein
MINPRVSVEITAQHSQIHVNDYGPDEPMLVAQPFFSNKSPKADQVDEEDGGFRSSNTKSAEYEESIDEESKISGRISERPISPKFGSHQVRAS